MTSKVNNLLLSNLLAASFIVGVYSDTALAKDRVLNPVVMETLSEEFPEVQPSPYTQLLATYEYPEIRHVSVTIWIDWSFELGESPGQDVMVLADTPGSGANAVAIFRPTSYQSFATFEFNAEKWYVRAFNNSQVNIMPMQVEYIVSTTYSP